MLGLRFVNNCTMEILLYIAYLTGKNKDFWDQKYSLEIKETLSALRMNRNVSWISTDAFMSYFRKNCEPFLDSLQGFFQKNEQEKRDLITPFQKQWTVEHVLGKYLLNCTYRELQKMLWNLYKKFESHSIPVTVITPTSLESKTRQHIREYYKSGVLFMENPEIVWGMITYKNSTLIDKSFISLVSRIFSLN